MSRLPRKLLLSLAAFGLLGVAPSPTVAQPAGCEGVEPYVFILLDTSAGMNRSAPCTQAQFDAGECGFVCATRDCSTPTAGDHPGSKIYQTRQALYEVLSGIDNVRFGFASLNQDMLSVRAKHWLYEATSAGPSINGVPYPAVGAREAFGAVWPCGSGTADSGVGCSYSAPADLPDAWERARVQRLPKGGIAFGDTVQIYVRSGNPYIYRITYQPVAGVLGGAIQTTVTTVRCTNSTCSSFVPIGSQTVDWTPVGDFLSFDNATSTPSRTAPETWFTESTAADASAYYPQCPSTGPVGWDSNTDSLADPANGYNLRWPTDSSDSRGGAFSFGDVIPLDWLDNHKEDLLGRLAPNVAADPLATPDFRTAAYFQDTRQTGESFLRLQDEAARPLIAHGPTSLAKAVNSFRRWFDDCTPCNIPNWVTTAEVEDPEWLCRRNYLVIVSDGGDTCGGASPYADVASLNAKWNMKTFVFAVGVAPNTDSLLRYMATNGKGEIYYPQTRQQLVDDLSEFFQAIQPVP
jgi:hypothetical protein